MDQHTLASSCFRHGRTHNAHALTFCLAMALMLALSATGAVAQCVGTIVTGNITRCPGGTASLTASFPLAGGTISWRRNGVALTNGISASGTTISGANTATLTLTNIDTADAGEYTVRYTLTFPVNCTGVSAAVNVVIPEPPVFTSQPSTLFGICEGSTATFSVTASGPPSSYQWRRSGTNLTNGLNASGTLVSGADTAVLSLAGIDPDDVGFYECVVRNACGSATSSSAFLSILRLPTVTTPPADVVGCTEGTASFSVTATGSGLISYRWLRNEVPIVDGTTTGGTVVSGTGTAVLTLTSISRSDVATYSCLVSTSCGSVTSPGALLTISGAPTITSEPVSVTTCAGANVTFSVAAISNGGGELRYQWLRPGITLVDGVNANGTIITGATSPVLTLGSVAPEDSSGYICVVENSCPIADVQFSRIADLVVNSPAAILASPLPRSACELSSTTFTMTISGGSPAPTIQWQKNGVNLTEGGRFTGVNSPSLTITALASSDEGNYRAVVSNSCTNLRSAPCTLTVHPQLTITGQPVSQTVCETANVTLAALANGFAPITFQWQKNGVNLLDGVNTAGTMVAGATTPFLTLSRVAREDSGSYRCVISSPCETENSSPAQLTVQDVRFSAQPPDQTACEGSDVTYTVTATGTPAPSYQWQRNNINLVNGINANGAVVAGATTPTLSLLNVTAGDAGTYRCIVSNSCDTDASFPSVLTIRTLPTVTPPPLLVDCEGGTLVLSVTVGGSPAPTIQWRRNGSLLTDGVNAGGALISGATTSTLTLTGATPGDTGTYTCAVTNPCGTVVSTGNSVLVRQTTRITTQPVNTVACAGTNTSLTVAAAGTPPFNYQWLRSGVPVVNGINASGTTVLGARTATLQLTSVDVGDSDIYSCRVTGTCGSITSSSASLVVGTPVEITSQPISREQCAGTSITLSVETTGTPLATFQWQRNNVNLTDGTTPAGTAISGATSATLSLNNTNTDDTASYRCIINSACNTVTSDPAFISITAGMAIAVQPQPALLPIGSNATFSIEASGPGTVIYRWQRNSVNLSNGTTASGTIIDGVSTPVLTLTGITNADSGTYRCVVSSICGTLPSSPAVLVPYVDLGTASSNTSVHTSPLAAGGIVWVRFTTTADASEPDRFLDIHTVGSVLSTLNPDDTEIGLYTASGARVADNDDAGSEGFSLLSFGQTVPARVYPPIVGAAAGQDLLLAAGTYYLAAGAHNMNFGGSNFQVQPASPRTGTIVINIHAGTATPACLADLNTDGTIDGSDFIDFINSFGISDAAIDPLADIVDAGGTPPADGTIDGSDFIAFINAFAAGC